MMSVNLIQFESGLNVGHYLTSRNQRVLRQQDQNGVSGGKNQKQKTDKAQQIPIPVQAQTETPISSAYIPVLVQTHARTSISSATNVDEPVVVNSPEKINDSIHEIDKLAMTEVHMAVVVEEPKDVLHNHPTNTPSVPSYMASTVSTKAKLKAQGSPKVSEDGAEYGVVRHYSLLSSTNGKFILLEKVQKFGEVGAQSPTMAESSANSMASKTQAKPTHIKKYHPQEQQGPDRAASCLVVLGLYRSC
ncbi:hypothetical protein KY284_034187 [Solanum tuberosum]|nr:hypothetical protein KY284_034187 [Solanum tuberosum]